MPPGDAEAAARRRLGNLTRIQENAREAWAWPRLETFAQALRYGLRGIRRSPGFALAVVLTLALGIGANAAIFTLVHAILMRSLPVADPAQLYRIGDTDDCCVEGGFPADSSTTGDVAIFSYDLYLNLKANTPEFEKLAAVQAGGQRWSVRRGN